MQQIYYPDMVEKDQAAEPDTDRARSQQTMYPGTLLGLLEYYCKSPRVVLRAYLVRTVRFCSWWSIRLLTAEFALRRVPYICPAAMQCFL
jgi:hypothetical protein